MSREDKERGKERPRYHEIAAYMRDVTNTRGITPRYAIVFHPCCIFDHPRKLMEYSNIVANFGQQE